jgi:hypothetical protein
MATSVLSKLPRIIAPTLALTMVLAVFHLTTFALTTTDPVSSLATSSATQTTTGASSTMMMGTSSPAATTVPTLGTEVSVPWIETVLPWRPWSVLRQGADYIVGANDLDHSTSLLLRVKAASGTVSRIATLNNDLFGLAVEGKYFIATDGNGNLLKISSKGAITTIASGVTSPGFASNVAVASSSYAVTDYVGGRLVRVASDGTVSSIAGGLRHASAVIYDDPDYIVGATASDTSEPYLYRVTATGTTTPIANLRPLLDFGQVTGIAKVGPDYYASSDTKIVRVTTDGTVSLVTADARGTQGLATDGNNLIVTDFGGPSLLQIATTTTAANSL